MANILDSIRKGIYKAGYKAGELAESAGKEVDKAVEGGKQLVKDLQVAPVEAITNLQKAAEVATQPVVDIGKATGKAIGAGLDVINPANLGSKVGTALANKITGKNEEYKPIKIAQPLGEAGGEIIASIPTQAFNYPLQVSKSTFTLNDEIDKYKRGESKAEDVALVTVDEIGKTGLAALNLIGLSKAPKTLIGVQTAMKSSGGDVLVTEGMNTIADTLSDKLEVKDENTRERVRSVFNSAQGIASVLAGIKGSKVASKPGVASKVKGASIAAAPDFAAIGAGELLGKEKNEDFSNAQKAIAAGTSLATALSPGELGFARKSKPSLDQGKFDIKDEAPVKIEEKPVNVSGTYIEEVPVSRIKEFSEFNRRKEPKYSQEETNKTIEELKESIKKEGIKEPLIIKYYQKDKTALLVEGNHRLQAAIELGLDTVPVTIVRVEKIQGPNKAKKVPGAEPDKYGYVPGAMKPSQILSPTKQEQPTTVKTKPLAEKVKKTRQKKEKPVQVEQIKAEDVLPVEEVKPVQTEEQIKPVQVEPVKTEPVEEVEPIKTEPEEETKTDEEVLDEMFKAREEQARQVEPNYQEVKTEVDNIIDGFTPKGAKASSTTKKTDTGFTVGGLVERGISKAKDSWVTLRNLMQTVRSSEALFFDALKKAHNVDLKYFDLGRKFDVTEDMVIGRITPNDGVEITSFSQVADKYKNFIPDSLKNILGNKKEVEAFENYAKASEVYNLNKDNPEFIAKTFTPEEVAKFEAGKEKMREIISNVGNMLVDYKILKDYDMVDDYIRYVQSQAFRNKMGVAFDILNQKKQDDIQSRMIIDMLRNTEKGLVAETTKGIAGLEEVGVSTLKDKGDDPTLDLSRIHSPEVQMLSYIYEASKALRNKTMVGQVAKFVQSSSGKGATENDKTFIANMFPSNSQPVINKILGLDIDTGSFEDKFSNFTSELSRMGTQLILLGKIPTAIQPMLSSFGKALYMTTTRGVIDGAKGVISPTKIGEVFDEETRRDLGAFGYTHPYEPNDTRRPGIVVRTIAKAGNTAGAIAATVGDAMNTGVAWSSGALLEYPQKAITALTMMKNYLKSNGIEVGSSPKDIVAKWKEFQKNPETKEAFQLANDHIQDTMSWIGESNIMTKSNIDWIRKGGFKTLAGYVNGQTNKMLRDFSVALGRTEASGKQRGLAAERTAVGLLTFATSLGIIMNAIFDDEDDKNIPFIERVKIAYPIAHRMSGFTPAMIMEQFGGFLNSPVTVLPKLLISAASTAGTLMTGDEADKAVAVGRFLDTISKTVGLAQTTSNAIDVATGETGQRLLGKSLGAIDMEDITASNVARGKKTNTTTEALAKFFGFDVDGAVIDYIWNDKDEEVMRAEWEAKGYNPLVADAVAEIGSVGKGLLKDFVRPLESLTSIADFNSEKYDARNLVAIRDVADKLTREDTLGTHLSKLGITDKTLQYLIKTEIAKSFQKLRVDNIEDASMIGQEGKTIEEILDTKFGEIMYKNLTENPKIFNDTIAGLSRVYKNADDLMTNSQEAREKIKQYMTPALAGDSAGIASYYGTNPNVTSLSISVGKGIDDIMSLEKPKDFKGTDAEYKIEQLKHVDNMFKNIYQMLPIAEGVERSLALKSTEITTKIEQLAKTLRDPSLRRKLLEAMPNISNAIARGLVYRGFRANQEATQVDDGLKQPTVDTGSLASRILANTESITKPTGTKPLLIEKAKAYDPMKIANVASPIKKTTEAKVGPSLASRLLGR